ncbi:MAG: type III polyketide synthase [Pirellulaceae bacterium]|nr:type III polyketide synthase [Pirellulaceae bacterium]
MNKPLLLTIPSTATFSQRISRIVGLATSTPQFSISQADAAEVAQQLKISERWNHALPKLYRKSGVDRRSSVLLQSEHGSPISRQCFYPTATDANRSGPSTLQRMKAYAEYAGPLLAQACSDAIAISNIDASVITHLVTVSCTGFFAPGVDLEIIRRLELSPNVQRTHVGFMGCHGALNGLNAARSITQSDPEAVVMLGAVELCSLHQQYSEDPQQLVANSLFADGAASLILAGSETSDFALNSQDFDENTSWTVQSHCSFVLPGTSSMMSWTIGNDGFVMTLDPHVPSIIEQSLHEVIQKWLASQFLSIAEIGGWAIHPGGPRIVESAGRALGLSDEALIPSLSVLRDCGNMSSPTVLFILDKLWKSQPDSQTIVMLAFGPGLCIEASLLSRQ